MELLGIWPPLPIVITNTADRTTPEYYDLNAAIAHRNRVCEIDLRLSKIQLQLLASAMQEQFPVLIHLKLEDPHDYGKKIPLPDEFLGGFAPRLQSLNLNSIPFPALPKLLLSATDLVRLTLWDIPDPGYISPEAIVTSLAVLANLKFLTIGFEYFLSFPDQERHPPPLKHTVLPVLTHFEVQGVSEYVEDLVSRIDVPLLDYICITFLHEFAFDTSQLAQFLRRTTRLQALNEAYVHFDYFEVQVQSFPPTQSSDEKSGLKISHGGIDGDITDVTQVLTSLFPSIYTVEHLYIYAYGVSRSTKLEFRDDIENIQWLEIFRPFTAVKKLYMCEESAIRIALALEELVEESMVHVLPTLEGLFWEELEEELEESTGFVQENFDRFVNTRQLVGNPVAVSHWARNEDCVDSD